MCIRDRFSVVTLQVTSCALNHPRMQRCNASVVASVCVSACLQCCNFWKPRIDVESSFRCAATSSETSGQNHISRSSGQGQGHTIKKPFVYSVRWWSEYDWKVILLHQQFTMLISCNKHVEYKRAVSYRSLKNSFRKKTKIEGKRLKMKNRTARSRIY